MRAEQQRGRGAVSNPTGRFEQLQRSVFDDGWDAADEAVPRLETLITSEKIRSIISNNDSPDADFHRPINPYRGCEHGCIYCSARPTHAYLGLSPGQDFESRLRVKVGAGAALEGEFRKPSYRCKVLAIGLNTDAYQPIERSYRLTREVLDVLSAWNHPVGLITKSYGIVRDVELLADMAARKLVNVSISLTTLDRVLARKMEPRAAAPARRLAAIEVLSAAGVPVNVMVAPIVPGLTDHETEAILYAAKQAGARSANYSTVRLPLELKELFTEWLEAHYPARKTRVLSLLRQMHDDKLYDPTFGVRSVGTGPYADIIATRFAAATRRLGLAEWRLDLDCGQFRAPPGPQLSLPLFR